MLEDDKKVFLIDCREPDEHAIVSISQARLIPLQQIPQHLGEIAASDTPVVVHCHHGMRSAQAAGWLRENGVPHARSMAGGIDAWAEQIDPGLPRY